MHRTRPPLLPLLLATILATGLLTAAPSRPAAAGDAPTDRLQVLPISTQHWIGDNDLILQLFDAQGQPIIDRDAPTTWTLVGPDGVAREPVAPVIRRWAALGRDLYVARVPLDQIGAWTVVATVELDGETITGSTGFTVSPDDGTPALGSLVPDVDTPKLVDVNNLTDALSSDPDQVAAFYWFSVTDQLRNGQPFVFILDSYAFRPNEACGGALGIIHDIFIEYPTLSVIHAEPWEMRFAAGQLTLEPPEGPASLTSWSEAYGVKEPPWVFVVDEDGRLRAKFTNVFGTDELRAAMTAVSRWLPLGSHDAPVPPAPPVAG